MARIDGRQADQIRPVTFELDYIEYPEGSVLVCTGKTKVLCNVTVEEGVPEWMEKGEVPGGWITAEYAMLPRSTHTRRSREVDGWGGRTQEIRRLIGRSLRAGFRLHALGSRTCIVDCDVLQADGGTRTAAITGGYVAVVLALRDMVSEGEVSRDVFAPQVAATSVGLVDGRAFLDLNYAEDAQAGVDINVVMNDEMDFIEVQGTAEGRPFSRADLEELLDLAAKGITQLMKKQRQVLDDHGPRG